MSYASDTDICPYCGSKYLCDCDSREKTIESNLSEKVYTPPTAAIENMRNDSESGLIRKLIKKIFK